MEKSNKIWWKSAVNIFSEISTWIIVPVILALIIGKSIDRNYGTEPWGLLIFAGFGFLISSFGIVNSVKKYGAKIKKEEENNN